jgi:hypothetical protein
MRPRILLRTHYQAHEPRAIIAAVTACSSPTETRHEDAVATALVRWAKENDYTLSIPGAVYAVGNARSLGLLSASCRWSATGLAFGYIHNKISSSVRGHDPLTLTAAEARLYLRCYLVNGGALLIKFGQWLVKRGGTTDDELRSESVIERLLIEALDEYLTIATDIRDRTAIRIERDRLSRSEYVASTKRHKSYPLLSTMYRLGLVAFGDTAHQGRRVSPDPERRLVRLLNALPDVTTLERSCGEHVLEALIDTAFSDAQQLERPGTHHTATLLADAYRFAMGRGLHACPLSYLDDLLFGYALIDASAPGKRATVEDRFQPLHRQWPTDVRFHVDRRGRRAFVIISGETSRTLEERLANIMSTSSSAASS